MKICIYGAGAIGGYLGVKLALAGADVSLIARGNHLNAMREKGLTLHSNGETNTVHLRCTDNPEELGIQDYIIIALKAHALPTIVDKIQPLLGTDTAVVTATNGIPWWYFYKLSGLWENYHPQSIDPDSKIWNAITPERAIGCVVYQACEIVEPGVIIHTYGDRFTLGEPDGTKSARCNNLSEIMTKGGLKAPVRPNIRNEIWLKLWGNLCFNPISALTHATLEQIGTDPGTRALARAMMLEAQAIGEALGVNFGIGVDKRIEGAVSVGSHKTSMLQDLENNRIMEIDALVTVVQELGCLVNIATPYIDTVLALVQQRAIVAGCYSREQGIGNTSTLRRQQV